MKKQIKVGGLKDLIDVDQSAVVNVAQQPDQQMRKS